MKKVIGIYKLLSPSGKCYIGQSTNIFQRFRDHKRAKNKTGKLYNAIKKYGFDNFKTEILEECLFELLDEREVFWIKKYNAVAEGYNCDHGGQQSKIFSIAHRKKLSLAATGNYNGGQNIRFLIDDSLYFSIGEANKKLGIPLKTIHNRLNSTNPKYSNYLYENVELRPIRKPIKTIAKGITIDNVYFKTIREASETLKIPTTTLWRRYIKPLHQL